MLHSLLFVTNVFAPTFDYLLSWANLQLCTVCRPILFACPCSFSHFLQQQVVIYVRFDATNVWLQQLFPSGGRITRFFLPEITLSVMIISLLLMTSIDLRNNRLPKALSLECWAAACVGLFFVFLLYAIQLFGAIDNVPVAGDYLYVSRGLTAAKLLVTLTTLFVLYMCRTYIREHTYHVLELPLVMLISLLLLLLLVSANNLMLVFFTLSGFSLTLYILILYDGADLGAREAALKYFYLSTLSAGLLLFGALLVYTSLGDATYYTIRSHSRDEELDPDLIFLLSAGVVFVLFGFFFKLSAFPGHLWAVEVYEASPMPVMAFFMLPVKVAIFITFLRLLNTAFLEFSHIWLPCVTFAALGSLLWGAIAASQARKIIRFLGYASINQIGFLLLGLAADTDDALRSAVFYLILYTIMTGGFLLVFTHLRKGEGGSFIAISDFRGLGSQENLVCWNLSVFLFSMAGIPPLAGFFGKYYLLSAIMEKGLFIPVIASLVISLITSYYYLRIIKTFWFEESIAEHEPVLLLSSQQRTVLSVLEASLWIAAAFAPWLLPALNDVATTLTLCADASTFLAEASSTFHPTSSDTGIFGAALYGSTFPPSLQPWRRYLVLYT